MQIPERLILKNTIVKPHELLILLVLPVSLYFLVFEDSIAIVLIAIAPILLLAVVKLVKRLGNRNPIIIIDRRGIELCEEGRFYEWSKVEYAFIKRHASGHGKHSKTIDRFHLISNGQEKTIDLTDIKFNRGMVKAAIQQYSGRNIADASDKFRDEVAALLRNKQYADQVAHRFKKFKLKQSIIALAALFIPMGISIYFQASTHHWYSVGLGFTTALLLTLVLSKMAEQNFRRTEYIADLSDQEFNKIGIKYEVKYSKKTAIGLTIFLALSTAAIFVISYFATRP